MFSFLEVHMFYKDIMFQLFCFGLYRGLIGNEPDNHFKKCSSVLEVLQLFSNQLVVLTN